MKSLTHDFDYIDNFVTFLFYVGRSHHLRKNNFKNKQFKQGFTGTTLLTVPSHKWFASTVSRFGVGQEDNFSLK